jgi:1-acyl-sn-glycerol-3-phosphate acyltransferase
VAFDVARFWARLNLAAFGIRVRTRRLAHLDPKATYVFMANHRSHLDVLAVIAALGEFQLRWVAKRELTRVPFFGWALKRAGHIIVDRGDHAQAVATLRAAERQTDAGISVIIFPEGTRAPTAEALLPFKKGGFMLAIQTGLPIVPIAVRGSLPLLPKKGWRIRAGTIEVVVGAPILVAGVPREELMARVRGFLQTQLDLPADAPAAPEVAVRAS